MAKKPSFCDEINQTSAENKEHFQDFVHKMQDKGKENIAAKEQQLSAQMGSVSSQLEKVVEILNKIYSEIQKDINLVKKVDDLQNQINKIHTFKNIPEEHKANLKDEEYKALKAEVEKLHNKLKEKVEKKTALKASSKTALSKAGIDLSTFLISASGNSPLVKNLIKSSKAVKAYLKEKHQRKAEEVKETTSKPEETKKEKREKVSSTTPEMSSKQEEKTEATGFSRVNKAKPGAGPENVAGDFSNATTTQRLYDLNYEMWATLLSIDGKIDISNKNLNNISDYILDQNTQRKAERFENLEKEKEAKTEDGGMGTETKSRSAKSFSEFVGGGLKGFAEEILASYLGVNAVPTLLAAISVPAIAGALVPIVAGVATIWLGNKAISTIIEKLNKPLDLQEDSFQEEHKREKDIKRDKDQLEALKADNKRLEDALNDKNLTEDQKADLLKQQENNKEKIRNGTVDITKKQISNVRRNINAANKLASMEDQETNVKEKEMARSVANNQLLKGLENQLAVLQGTMTPEEKNQSRDTRNKALEASKIVPTTTRTTTGMTPPNSLSTPGLGSVSAQFESGKSGAGTISTGRGDLGGVSYGTYQLSTNSGTLKSFLKSSGYENQFSGLKPGTPEFNNQWKALASSDPNFGQAQQDFIGKTHYTPQLENLKKSGLDLEGRGKAVQESLFSTSTQFGPHLGSNVVKNALQGKSLEQLSDSDIVSSIQDYKIKNNESLFKSSSPGVRSGTLKRAEKEKALLLSMLSQPDYSMQSKRNNDGLNLKEATNQNINLQTAQQQAPPTVINQTNVANPGAGNKNGRSDPFVESPRPMESTFAGLQIQTFVTTNG